MEIRLFRCEVSVVGCWRSLLVWACPLLVALEPMSNTKTSGIGTPPTAGAWSAESGKLARQLSRPALVAWVIASALALYISLSSWGHWDRDGDGNMPGGLSGVLAFETGSDLSHALKGEGRRARR
jgi:hypothetical protein